MVRIGLLGIAALALCSCGASESSSAAPPTVICGTTLSHEGAGPVVTDATGSHMDAVIRKQTVGGLFIIVASGCDHGAQVTWTPKGDATLVKSANAKDGLPVAVVLRPTKRHDDFTVIGTQDGQRVSRAVVQLTS